jgi:pyrroline-5-carboxylate reductase
LKLSALNKITFIGAGNMAGSIIGGLINSGVPANIIHATTFREESRHKVESSFGIQCGTDNIEACRGADIIILAVKPQKLKAVCEEIASSLDKNSVILSVAAGINCESLARWLGDCALVRAMPNTPSLVGEGASGYFANIRCNEEQKALAKHCLEAVGIALEVNSENLIDSVTAISGSAPAYFFLFIEEMVKSGVKLGLDAKIAEKLAIQTAFGSAKLAQQSDVDVAELRRRVTSPKGTTEQAVLSFQKNNLGNLVETAMNACANRAEELAKELGQ